MLCPFFPAEISVVHLHFDVISFDFKCWSNYLRTILDQESKFMMDTELTRRLNQLESQGKKRGKQEQKMGGGRKG
jgi:hypothetical protein